MFRAMLVAATLLWAISAPTLADERVEKAPPPAPYQKVSALVKLPDFLPSIGTLYIDPKTLPAGPFLAYDHNGRLVSTIYMIPLKDLNSHKKFEDLASPGGAVDHVELTTTPGIPAFRNRTITSSCGM